MRVLLIEDDPAEAQAAMRALRASGAASEVHWVSDGEQALDFLFCSGAHAGRDPGEPPALVVIEIKLPKIDGIEVLRRMKGSHLKSIRVVVTASSPEERDVLESYRLGVDAYVLKPLAPEALRDAVAKLGLS